MKTYEIEVDVAAEAKNKRRELVERLDVALIANAVRVPAGTWRVTLTRVPAKVEPDDAELEAALKNVGRKFDYRPADHFHGASIVKYTATIDDVYRRADGLLAVRATYFDGSVQQRVCPLWDRVGVLR
jgi:hypothetical protein